MTIRDTRIYFTHIQKRVHQKDEIDSKTNELYRFIRQKCKG